jgi:hypothetical protein
MTLVVLLIASLVSCDSGQRSLSVQEEQPAHGAVLDSAALFDLSWPGRMDPWWADNMVTISGHADEAACATECRLPRGCIGDSQVGFVCALWCESDRQCPSGTVCSCRGPDCSGAVTAAHVLPPDTNRCLWPSSASAFVFGELEGLNLHQLCSQPLAPGAFRPRGCADRSEGVR